MDSLPLRDAAMLNPGQQHCLLGGPGNPPAPIKKLPDIFAPIITNNKKVKCHFSLLSHFSPYYSLFSSEVLVSIFILCLKILGEVIKCGFYERVGPWDLLKTHCPSAPWPVSLASRTFSFLSFFVVRLDL